MKYFIFSVLIYFSFQYDIVAQTNETNGDGPPVQQDVSLNNQSLNSNVDLSTGALSSSIHLMDLDGGNGTILNLDLVYQGKKGMKVNDVAGPFGTGFHLKGGGYIKRIVRGIPDEKEYSKSTLLLYESGQGPTIPPNPDDPLTLGEWMDFGGSVDTYPFPIPEYQPGFFSLNTDAIGWLESRAYISGFSYQLPNYFRNINSPAGVSSWESKVSQYYSDVYGKYTNQISAIDGEPDIYQFQFGDYQGSFVFGNDGKPVMLPYQDIKVESPENYGYGSLANSRTDSWVFTTSDGTKYKFINTLDYYEKTSIKIYNPNIHGYLSNCYVSQWNLSSITTTDGNIFNFTYENELPIHILSQKDYIQKYVAGDQATITPENFSQEINTYIGHKWLKRISSSFGKIEFNKNPIPRLDFKDDIYHATDQFSIANIKKYNNNGDVQSNISFNFDSYSGTICPNGKRLFLNNVTFENLKGEEEKKIYSFKYYFENEMPDINSKKQDLFGYFNNNNSNNLIPSAGTYTTGGDRSINGSHAIVGMLKKIIFPAGGSKEFFYESNDFFNSVTVINELTGGMRINKIIEHPEFNQGNDIITLYSYKDELNPSRSSGEALPIRKLFDNQQSLFRLNPPQDNTIYCLVAAQPIREMSDDWIRYNSVTVKQIGNGKKIYKLTSHSTNPDLPAERYLFTPNVDLAGAYKQYFDDKDNDAGAPNTDMSYDRGLITNLSIYNEAGDKIEETIYNYDFNPIGFPVKEVKALRISSDLDIFRAINERTTFNLEYYKYISKLHILNNTIHNFFDVQNNLSISEITNFSYNLSKHSYVTEVKKSNSDGSILSTKYIYPQDISNSNLMIGTQVNSNDAGTICLRSMIEKNIVSIPLETISKTQNNNGLFVTGASLKTFELFNISALQKSVKLSKTYELEIDQPINDFNEVHLDNALLFVKDSRYTLRKIYDKYDTRGNLIQESFPFGISNSYIYSSALPKMIGQVSNAKISISNLGDESSYTGFESVNINDVDHWLDHIYPIVFSPISHTGDKSIKLQNQQIVKEFIPSNQNQKYRFSCYIKTQSGIGEMNILSLYTKHDNDNDLSIFPLVPGSFISIPCLDTHDEWKYIEGIIDLGKIRETSGISTSTNLRIRCQLTNFEQYRYLLIDDIRFQPYYSDFETITYDKISGNGFSYTDNNGITNFYSYNGLNQLSSISDNNHNVLQSYSSHLNHDLISNDFNYNKTTTLKAPHLLDELVNGSVNSSDLINDYVYYDGLQRPIQRNIQGITPDSKDFIQPITYDIFGRKNKKYLPYSDGNVSGMFRTNSINDQFSFYQATPLIEHSNKPFSESKYDNSPLNLIKEIGLPGANWCIGSGHTKTSSILTNLASDNVINWNYSGVLVNGQNNFIAGVLYKLETFDEDGNKKIVFKNKIGQILLERKNAKCSGIGVNLFTTDQTGVLNNGSNNGSLTNLDTYYVYDTKGLLAFILPPAAVNKFKLDGVLQYSETDPVFQKFTFSYKYDNRERLISRRIPGQQGLNYYVYDKRNQLVLFQTPDQIDGGKWNFIKYDVLGRKILNGIFVTTTLNNPVQLQSQINSNLFSWEKRTTINTGVLEYSDELFPSISGNENSILTVYYYDDYSWDKEGRNFQSFGTTSTASPTCYGIETGKKDKVLDGTAVPVFLTTVNYFDNKLRLIQTHKKHILNDWDIFSNEFSFTNRLLKNIREHRLSNKITTISTRYLYDHANRLTDIFKTISKFDGVTTQSDNEIHEAFIQYNKIGQVIKKSLHYNWAGTAAYLQDIDYRYNIRGWLTSINNSKLINDGGITNTDDFDAFGENIYYGNCSATELSSADGIIKGNPQFNGNISAIKWKVRAPNLLPTKAIEQLYVYRYDGLNRMTAGYYASDENLRGFINTRDNTKNFDEIVDYDLMGNITSLRRNNLLGQIDNLNYSYDGNQLTNIIDNATLQSDYDFHDKSNTTDYLYNKKGSLITDNNKGLNIIYNDINLPQNIVQAGINLDFLYSGSGEKLKKIFKNSKHYYISGIEYEDKGDGQGPKLVFIQSEEGRIRPKSANATNPGLNRSFVYDYFLKDHLGNVRAILSEEITKRSYYATMEPQNAAVEDQVFINTEITRKNRPAVEPLSDLAPTDEMVSDVGGGGTTQIKIGLAKVLKVSQGDQIDINTKYFFDITNFVNTQYSVSDFLGQLAYTFISGIGSFTGNVGENQLAWTQQTFQNNPGINSFLTSSFQNPAINDPSKPHSYLVYLFFDDKFNFHSDASGMLQVRDPNVLGNLGILNLKMPANGFFYVYTNNESNVKVYFNDLTISHTASVLKEENHFYPYGLLMEGITPVVAANGSINKYKFSDSELQLELGLNQYDFSARFYDPVIGRFNVIDPFADFAANFTSYRYAFDNPVSYSDPSGLWEEDDEGGGERDDEEDPKRNFVYWQGDEDRTGERMSFGVSDDEEENYKGKWHDEFNDREETAFEELKNENSGMDVDDQNEDNENVQGGGGAKVYIENDGIGHTYIEVDGTVFSYGRYDGSYSPSSGTFGPVGKGVLLKEKHSFAVDRMGKNPTTVYNFPQANAKIIYNYLNNVYNSGTPGKNGGMVVDTYLLFGNNCTTMTCGALRVGGVDFPILQTPLGFDLYMKYPNQFGEGFPPR